VIEYFSNTLEEPPGNACLRMNGDSGSRVDLEPLYDSASKKFTVSRVVIADDDNRVHTHRWEYVRHIVVIEQSPTQTYFNESLNHPHYSVHPIEYESYKNHLKTYQRKNGGLPQLHFCPSTRNHCIKGFITINNSFHKDIQLVLDGFDLQAIVSQISQHGQTDSKRGNKKLDTGLTSALCPIRRDKWYGICGPNELKHTHDKPMVAMRKQLYKLLDCGVPEEWMGRVYHDPERQHYFEIDESNTDYPGVQIHSTRAAMGYPFSALLKHIYCSLPTLHAQCQKV
jgi:hypothetical protein